MKYLLMFLTTSVLYGCYYSNPMKTGLEGKEMPGFNLLLMDSVTTLNTKDIPAGQANVLFFFMPDCPTCKLEIEDILNNKYSFDKVHFYLISSSSFTEIKQYYNYYQLRKYPNFTIGQDFDWQFVKYFSATGVPFLAVYDKEKKLKKVFVGKVGMNLLKQEINEIMSK